ncbi:hypothetical protein NDI39_24655 [Microcoleus sp. ZQ-A2]|nr:hypothetical protein [Microcoleus sp. FACHB-1]
MNSPVGSLPGFCERTKAAIAKGRRQKAEGRRQKAEGRRQKAEGRRQKAEGRRQKAEGRRQKAEGRRQMRVRTEGAVQGSLSIFPKY